MIISNSRNFIFVHIPKCGGTSVSSFLEKSLLPQDVTLNTNKKFDWDRYRTAYRERFGLFKHSTAKKIAKAIKPEYFKTYYVFTFTRNPFARAYSAFTFTKRADAVHRPESKRHNELKKMSFEDFLKSEYVQEKTLLQTKEQATWVQDAPGEVHPFKLEEIESAFTELSERFYGGKASPPQIQRRNVSSSNPNDWRRMSEKEADLIRELYAVDFNTFNYPLEIPALEEGRNGT